MTGQILAILISTAALVFGFAAGRKVLFAMPFMLSRGQKGLRLGLGLLLGFALFVLIGAFFFLPTEAGSEDEAPIAAAVHKPVELVWHTDLDKASQLAAKAGKPLLVDAWAVWCKPCKKLFKEVLTHESINRQMSQFVLLKLDADDEANEKFLEDNEVEDDLPWIGFFTSDGKLLKQHTLSGEVGAVPFSGPDKFAVVLDKVLEKYAPPSSDGVVWLTDLKEGFAASKAENKPLLVDGWAVWCTSCIQLKKETFPHPKVAPLLKDFVVVALDMDDEKNQWVWDKYGIKGLPWVAVFEPGEEVKPRWMLPDFEPPEKFAQRLTSASVEQDDIGSWLKSKGLFVTLMLVFLAGILASLTPCAYPSYFLVVGFLRSARMGETVGGRFLTAVLLVAGMASSYCAAGLIAALGGGAVGRVMTNPWVMGGIAVLFVFMGASSIGVAPAMEFTRLKQALQGRQKANFLWALVFGLVMGLIVAPCVGPILIAILTYIAAEGDMVLGMSLMVTFALGMGVLFFLLAMFYQTIAAKLKPGKFGEAITLVFGVLFFAAAFYYLKGVIPYESFFALFEF